MPNPMRLEFGSKRAFRERIRVREIAMADSSDSVSVDMDSIPLAGKEHIVKTGCGSVSVSIFGDQDKPALITYPDLALNHMSCFQGLLFCPEAFSLLLHNFCIYHISPPGHELGAAIACPEEPLLSVDDLADQIAEILNYFGLGAVMCLGVTAGAYILTLFALKYSQRVMGLILVSPVCKAPSWTEWFWNKVMSNLLYICGMCGLAKDLLLMRYFSKVVRGSVDVPESDVVQSCRRLLGERQSSNVLRFLEALNERPDITNGLRKLQCRSLIFVGENSPFHYEALHMTSKLDRRFSALVEVCYSLLYSIHHLCHSLGQHALRNSLHDEFPGAIISYLSCKLLDGLHDVVYKTFHNFIKVLQSNVGQRGIITWKNELVKHFLVVHSHICLYTCLQVQACGSMVTEEQPDAMLIPLEYFLMGFGFYRPSQFNVSPRSPLSPTCIVPELFSPESMGLKLKPIKTRIHGEVLV